MHSRSWDVFSLGSCFLPDSCAIVEAHYSGTPVQILLAYIYRTITVYDGPFQATSISQARTRPGPTTPHLHMVSHANSVWTLPFSLAANRGISVDFSSSSYLDASVRKVPAPKEGAPQIFFTAGSPIRASPDRRLHAPTRSISLLATPFFSAQAKPSVRRRIMPSLGNPHSYCVRGLCTTIIVSPKAH